jgi:hypothetical protein
MYPWLLIASSLTLLSASYIADILGSSVDDGLRDLGFTPRDPMHLKLAVLNPTFTYAAYENNSLQTFYMKYLPITGRSIISNISDLNLLSNKTIPDAPFYLYNQAADEPPSIPDQHFIDGIVDTVINFAPKSNITYINDQDVESGKLFYPNGTNAYDVIFLLREEYATQTGYDSLKRFVEQGGTIVFTESGVLRAQVNYNRQNDSITLVKGHHFQFDGKVVKRIKEDERWKNETSQWIGSNILPELKAAYFKHMPFNYTHTEEQYISNPNAVILFNYNLVDSVDPKLNYTVASYQMNYGKGKILMVSLFANKLDNDRDFFKFFKTVILPRAIGSVYKINLNGSSHDIYGIGYNNTGSGILQHRNDIVVAVNQSMGRNSMILDIPKQLFAISDQVKPTDVDYSVTIDNNKRRYNVTRLQNEVGFEIPINNDSRVIKISASLNPTPFALSAPSDLTIKAQGPLTTVSDLGKPTIQPRMDPMPMVRNDAPAKFPLGLTAVKWTASDASGHNASDIQVVNIVDKNYPIIRITYPKDRTVVPLSGSTIIIKGTTFDNEGVEGVDVQAISKFSNKTLPYGDVISIRRANWSSWNFPLDIRGMINPIQVTARVTDVSGHQSWAHVAFDSKN